MGDELLDSDPVGAAILQAGAAPGSLAHGLGPPPTEDPVFRRTSYFMLFRLGLLALFTGLAGFTTLVDDETAPSFEIIAWVTLGVAYASSLWFAWRLRVTNHVGRIAWGQTMTDIVLSAIVIVLTGGADSGFAFLFLIAILGAAVMGDRRQVYITAIACLLVFLWMTALQFIDVLVPLRADGRAVNLPPWEMGLAVLRTSAAMIAVSVLSAYLNSQLLSSVSQLGSLRALNEHIVRSLTSGLLTVDGSGTILFANPTALLILGRAGDPTGLRCEELIPGLAAKLADHGPARFELSVRRADQRMVELGINTSLLRDADGHVLGHVVHFQDTTKIRELERRLRRNERLAAIGGLAASVAHEVRNPLAAIAGSAELLAGSTLGETDRRLLEVILRESSRLDRTVGDLLDYTRPRSPEFLSVDLVDLVRNVTDSFRADPANQAVVVELHLPEHLELELDPSQFSQVLWNLLRNATEAMRGKGTIAVRARSAAGHALVEVKDTGPGIDEAQQDRVFEPFYSTKPSGSGIGLALVHKIVEEHGGEIDLRSRPGEGTAFRIELPLTRANASTR